MKLKKPLFYIIIITLLSIILYTTNPLLGVVDWLYGRKKVPPMEIITFLTALCGGIIIYFQLKENNKRNRNMEQTNAIAERGQVNTRFKDAATLLGGTQTASILSGIYALHQIAVEAAKGDNEQQGYVKTIHEILCAYLRENSTTQPQSASQTIGLQAFSGNKPKTPTSTEERVCTLPTIVVQTLVDVLFKNKGDIYGEYKTDLKGVVFEEIDFRNAVLTYVRFYKATLNNTSFTKAELNDTLFSKTTLNKTEFNSATLSNTAFHKTTLNDIAFHKTTLNNTRFNFATLNNKTSFKEAILTDAQFSGATLNDTSFYNAKLTGTSFYKATLNNTKFDEATLNDTRFNEATLKNNTWFYKATLKNTEFNNATIDTTWFRHATLDNTSFKGADLKKIDFRATRLERIDFSNLKHPKVDNDIETTLEDVSFTGTVLAQYVDHTAPTNELKYKRIIKESMKLTTPPPSTL